jgi:hypothetical protein
MKKIYKLVIILLCLASFRSLAQCGTPTTVPYYESFESITAVNQLPTCWAASNMSITCRTFTNTSNTGSKCAGFYYSPPGSNYFYSAAIQLYAGVIYSTSVWYNTGFNSGTDWTNFSILVGPNQSTTGLVTVASTSGPVVTNVFTSLSNTFSVGSSGVYYMAVKGVNSGAGNTQFLLWDDLMITIPCTGAGAVNSPTVVVTPLSPTICAGESITFTLTGADTYSLGGPTGSIVVQPPLNFPTNFIFAGTNTLTGCIDTETAHVTVNQTPILLLIPPPKICFGQSAALNVFGAYTYSLNDNPVTLPITVSPTVNSAYTLTAENSYGCRSSQTLQILVDPLPVVTVSNSITGTVCAGEEVILTGHGASAYQWSSSVGLLTGTSITLTPGATVTYSVSGTDLNGCIGKTNFLLKVDACLGLNRSVLNNDEIRIYPNPGNGLFNIESGNNGMEITVTDITGKNILSDYSLRGNSIIDLARFKNGIYYVKIKTQESSKIIKLIKE